MEEYVGFSGEAYENLSYRFTDGERKSFFKLLKFYRHKNSDSFKKFPDLFKFFINRLEWDVQWLIWAKNSGYSRTQHREELQETAKNIKKCIKSLRKISEQKLYIPLQKLLSIDPDKAGPIPLHLATLREQIEAKGCLNFANKSIEPLERLLEIVEYYQACDEPIVEDRQFTTKFIQQFSKTYTQYIGKPTQYRDGLFFEIIRRIFEILDVPSKDPSRAIKNALTKN